MRRGLGYLLDGVALEHVRSVERGLRGGARPEPSQTPAERLRLALEELGPTFIKLGQIVSTRPDLLPPEYRLELAKLQDAAPHVSEGVAREAIELELGSSIDRIFASFDFEPLAAGSIGQAHAATLLDGTEVVVKLRRPGAVEQVTEDLDILRNFAYQASRRWETGARYDLVGLADEFAQTLRAELDYLQEGRNAERIATSFAGNADAQIPRVFWETTTSRVITLERIHGLKITDAVALDAASIDRRALVERATRVMAKMVFEDGFFHADPHPGNYFVQADGRIGIIDFGMVGSLDDRLRDQLGMLVLALMRGDPGRAARILLALGTAAAPVDRSRLTDDLSRAMSRYRGVRLGDIALGTISGDLLNIARAHGLTLPRDLALLSKAFIEEEGVAAELDPEFRLIEAVAPYASRHLAAELSPAALVKRMERLGLDIAELGVDLPGQLHRVLEHLTADGLEVHLRQGELEELMIRGERLGNRIAASVVAAAAIDGLTHLIAMDRARRRNRRPRKLSAAAGRLASISSLGFGRSARSGGRRRWGAARHRR